MARRLAVNQETCRFESCPQSQFMTCKGCGKQFSNEQEGQIGLCQSCWDELCEMTCWEKFNIVADGTD